MSLKHSVFSRVIPLTIIAGTMFSQTAGGPFIDHPSKRGEKIDCGKLYRPPSQPGKTRLTCSFGTDVDPNHEKNICHDTDADRMPPDERGRIAQTNAATGKIFEHLARLHGQCRFEAAILDYKLRVANGKTEQQAAAETDAIYNKDGAPDWRTERGKSCSLNEAWRRCELELNKRADAGQSTEQRTIEVPAAVLRR